MSDVKVILGSLGLGDHLLCNAIYREHAKTHKILIPCWTHNGSLKLGWYNLPFDATKFDQEFYRQAGMDFEKRWSEFKIPKTMVPHPMELEPFSWVHDDEERGFKIDLSKCGDNPNEIAGNSSLQQLITGLYGATEIHVINSSMLILADSVATPFAKRLVLHHYARKTVYPSLRKQWTVI